MYTHVYKYVLPFDARLVDKRDVGYTSVCLWVYMYIYTKYMYVWT